MKRKAGDKMLKKQSPFQSLSIQTSILNRKVTKVTWKIFKKSLLY